jgi:hypothetical protein
MTYNVKVGNNTIDIFNVIERYNNTYPSNFANFSPVADLPSQQTFTGLTVSETDIAGYNCTNLSAHKAQKPSGINSGYTTQNQTDNIFTNSWAAHRVHNNTTSETKYLPTGCNKVTIFLGGGGGGGGGTGNSNNKNWSAGGGGGGGGVVLAEGIPVTGKANDYYNVVAGAAGAGATARGSGSDGGTSSFHFINKHWNATGGNGGGTGYEKGGWANQGNGGSYAFSWNEGETVWSGSAGTAGNTDYYGSVGGHYNWNFNTITHGNHLRVYSGGGDTINNNADGQNANYYGGGGGGSGGNNQSQNEDGKGGSGSQGVVIVYFRYD